MTEEAEQDWRTAAERKSDIAQARNLREQTRKGGLRFEVYLPSSLAEWLLDLVEGGVFTDPGEAVFVILGEHRDLEPHADLREEILRRTLQAAMDDPRPGCTAGEAQERIGKLMSEPRAEPAVWRGSGKTADASKYLKDGPGKGVARGALAEGKAAYATPPGLTGRLHVNGQMVNGGAGGFISGPKLPEVG